MFIRLEVVMVVSMESCWALYKMNVLHAMACPRDIVYIYFFFQINTARNKQI